MFYVLSWLAVVSLLALWSFAAWAFHAITTWALSHAGAMAGGAQAGDGLRMPDWLAPWMPPEWAQALEAMASAAAPAMASLLGWAPGLSSVLSGVVWVVWALGSGLLVMLGLALTGLVAAWRRRSRRLGSGARPLATADLPHQP